MTTTQTDPSQEEQSQQLSYRLGLMGFAVSGPGLAGILYMDGGVAVWVPIFGALLVLSLIGLAPAVYHRVTEDTETTSDEYGVETDSETSRGYKFSGTTSD